MCAADYGEAEDQPELGYVESDSFCDVRRYCVPSPVSDDTHAEHRAYCSGDIFRLLSSAVYDVSESAYYW